MLASLQGTSDRVEGAELGTAYVRIDGIEKLYRGEAGAVSTLLNVVPSYLNPRIGVADAKFFAFVAARTCGAHGAFRVPKDVAAFLAPHSIDLLPVSTDVKSEMHRFGLHTMGAVASMRTQTCAPSGPASPCRPLTTGADARRGDGDCAGTPGGCIMGETCADDTAS